MTFGFAKSVPSFHNRPEPFHARGIRGTVYDTPERIRRIPHMADTIVVERGILLFIQDDAVGIEVMP